MSKFDIAGDKTVGQPKHRYELEINERQIRIHSTMPMGHHMHLFKQGEGVDSCELTGSYQITITVGKLFSLEAVRTMVVRSMDELMAPPTPHKKKEPVKAKKVKKVSFRYDDDDDDEEIEDEEEAEIDTEDDFFNVAPLLPRPPRRGRRRR